MTELLTDERKKKVDWDQVGVNATAGQGAPAATTTASGVDWNQVGNIAPGAGDIAPGAAGGDRSPSAPAPAGDSPAARPERFMDPVVQGFSQRPDDSTLAENLRKDIGAYKDGFLALSEAFMDNPLHTAGEMAKNFVPAMAESIIRWGRAASQGKFWQMAYEHPLEFVQDWSLPVSVAFSGGTTLVPKVFGTGVTAMRVTQALQVGARAAEVAGVVSDPVGNTALLGAKKTIGLVVRSALAAPKLSEPTFKMPIDLDPAVAKAPLLERLEKHWKHLQTSVVDATYPLRNLAREGEAARILAETGETVAKRTLTETPLETSVRDFAGQGRKILQTLETGFRDAKDVTAPFTRDSGPATYGPSLLEKNGRYVQVANELPFAPQEPIRFNQTLKDVGAVGLDKLRDYDVARRAVLDFSRPPTMVGQWNWDARRADFGNLSPDSLARTRGIDLEAARNLILEHDPMYHQGDAAFSPDVHNAWLKQRQFSADSLKTLEDGGLLTPESRAFIEYNNPNYTPYLRSNKARIPLTPEQRVSWNTDAAYADISLKDDGGFSMVGPGGQNIQAPKQVIKRMEGSLRMIQDPVTSRAVVAARIMREVELNQIMHETAKLADAPNSGVRRIETPAGAVAKLRADEVAAALDGAGVLERAAQGEDVLASTMFLRPQEGMGPNTVRYFDKGEAKFLEFTDPEVAQAMASLRMKPDAPMDRWFTGRIVEPARFIASVQRAGVTLEPGFTLGLNVIRDSWGALTYSKYGFVPVYDNVRGVAHYLGKSEVFDLWARSGGMQAHLSAVDRPALQKGLDNYLHPDNAPYLRSVSSWVRHPIQVLQALQEASEASTRLGEFNKGLRTGLKMQRGETLEQAISRARNQGIDVQKVVRNAGVASRDVSVDFGMRGADPLVRNWNTITAFQNAQIQSLDLFRRKFFEGTPKQRALIAAKAAISITLPSLFLHARLANDPEYLDVPDWEKRMFWHVRMPDYVPEIGGGLVRVPKPFEIGQLWGTLPVSVMDAMIGHGAISPSDVMARMLDFQPFGVPTALKPIADVKTNHDMFRGTPLHPAGVAKLAKTEQANATTSEFARILSKVSAWTAERLPGDRTKPREAGLTPIEIDHIIMGYTGTIGRKAGELTNPVLRPLRGGIGEAPAPKGGMIARTPVLSRLIANPTRTSQAVQDFYSTLGALERINNTATSLNFDGDRAKYIRENAQDIADAHVFRKHAQVIMTLSRGRDAVEIAPHLTGDQKRAQMDRIEKQVRQIAQAAMAYRKQRVEGRP